MRKLCYSILPAAGNCDSSLIFQHSFNEFLLLTYSSKKKYILFYDLHFRRKKYLINVFYLMINIAANGGRFNFHIPGLKETIKMKALYFIKNVGNFIYFFSLNFIIIIDIDSCHSKKIEIIIIRKI